MPCLNCNGSPSNESLELDRIKQQAKAHAQKKSVPMAIYKDYGEYRFCEASQAFAMGYPIKEILTNAQ